MPPTEKQADVLPPVTVIKIGNNLDLWFWATELAMDLGKAKAKSLGFNNYIIIWNSWSRNI